MEGMAQPAEQVEEVVIVEALMAEVDQEGIMDQRMLAEEVEQEDTQR